MSRGTRADWPCMAVRICALVASCIIAAGTLAAQTTLPVRGGEHADFTRLVIQMPEENFWQLRQDGRRATLTVTGPPLQFDLRQTFARIPRTRLRAAASQGDALVLDLACDCTVRAAEDIPEFLVIDILGESATPVQTRPAPRPPGLRADTAQDTARRAGQRLARALRGRDLPPDHTSLTLTPFEALQPDPPAPAPDQPERISRAALTAEIGQALTASISTRVLRAAEPPAPLPESEDAGQDTAPEDARAHIGIGSDTLSLADRVSGTERCALAAAVALPDNGAGSTILPAELYDALDRPDHRAMLDHARHLIYMGFGAEARMVARLVQPPSEEAELLAQIGYLADLVPAPDPAPVLALQGCTPMATLWAQLADASDTIAPADAQAVAEAVEALPPHLRIHLGADLVTRLRRQGARDIAQRVRAATDRVAEHATPELELARAALDLDNAGKEAPQIEAGLDPAGSDETLLFLLERHDRDDRPLGPDLLALAQDRLPVLRGTEQGQALTGLTLRALLRDGSFAQARDMLGREAPRMEDNQHRAARNDLLRGVALDAPDTEFVTLIFDKSPWDDRPQDASLRDMLADRLARLGFADHAALMRRPPPQEAVVEPAGMPASGTAEPGSTVGPESGMIRAVAPDDLQRARAAQQRTERAADAGIAPLPAQTTADPAEAGAQTALAGSGSEPGTTQIAAPDPTGPEALGNGGPTQTSAPALTGPEEMEVETDLASDPGIADRGSADPGDGTARNSAGAPAGDALALPAADQRSQPPDMGDLALGAAARDAQADSGVAPAEEGLLQQGRSALDDSAALRARLDRMLSSDPSP